MSSCSLKPIFNLVKVDGSSLLQRKAKEKHYVNSRLVARIFGD